MRTTRSLSLTPLEARLTPAGLSTTGLNSGDQAWVPLEADQQYVITAPNRELAPIVEVRHAGSGELINRFLVYESSFTGGVVVALGDVNGDGIPDIATAPGVDGGPNVRVFSGRDGAVLANFFAYEPSFRGGANVAIYDFTGDGRGELIIGSGVGGGPRVRVIDALQGTVLRDYFAYESTFRGGVNVAAGDFGGTLGKAIVAGAGVGGGPAVKVTRFADLSLAAAFFAYDASARGGVFVATGDLDGDARDDIVTGLGQGQAVVKVFDPEQSKEKLRIEENRTATGGVRVGVLERTTNSDAVIVVGNGAGDTPRVSLYPRLSQIRLESPSLDGAATWHGVYVGG